MNAVDVAALLLRGTLALTMIAHGWNHAFGGGRLPGTARWFGSIGMRPAKLHALIATVTELGCGGLLAVGALTPLAAGGVLGTMVVALITNHLRKGFFIFRPGEGYEYVLMISVVSVALAGLGGGYLSIDHAAGLPLRAGSGFVICLAAGLGGAAITLLTSWRPARPVTEQPEEA